MATVSDEAPILILPSLEVSNTAEERYPILAYFDYVHLPDDLQPVSRWFHAVAWRMAVNLPYSPETSACLRKLLEAKDCAVRAALSE